MSANEKDLIVGGQAVIEGVMMRTPAAYAIAVRRPDGTITHTGARLPKWSDEYPALRLPILRGAAVLVQSMALGIKALNYSAGEAFNEAETAEEVEVALTPAVVEGEGDFAGITGGVPGLFPVPTKKGDIHVEICSECHPFFTGKQKLVDTAGRVDRFNKRYGKKSEAPAETPAGVEGANA